MREVSPLLWFGDRELAVTPKHFTKAPTPMTDASYQWVVSTLVGRFSISSLTLDDGTSFPIIGSTFSTYFYFEDPAEAMVYELRWSGQ
jgi:hypothetical protein